MKRITISTNIAKEYAADLDSADTLASLRATLAEWEAYAGDAVDAVATWTDADFTSWRAALAMERAKDYMGDELATRFGMVLIPGVMLILTDICRRYHVPYPVAVDRLIASRVLKKDTTRYVFAQEVPS